ncbi:hypothetical protein EDC04DRAFT_2657163, partial [Pisolithus marmoratus]
MWKVHALLLGFQKVLLSSELGPRRKYLYDYVILSIVCAPAVYRNEVGYSSSEMKHRQTVHVEPQSCIDTVHMHIAREVFRRGKSQQCKDIRS